MPYTLLSTKREGGERGGGGRRRREERGGGRERKKRRIVVIKYKLYYIHVHTVEFGSHIALTKLAASTVQGLTVSVLPSRYNRVIEASYVKQNLPLS